MSAPRVVIEDLIDNIVAIEYVTHVSNAGQVLRWCVLTTRNGFAVTGKPSCAVSKENDNEVMGKEIAYENAQDELWALMGYELKSRIARGEV